MENIINILKTILQGEVSSQPQQITQVGWNDSPDGNGYVPVFSNDPNPPKYPGTMPQTVQTQIQQPIQTILGQNSISLTPENVSNMIRIYGGKDAPILRYAPNLAGAANRYDFWKNNPELLALVPHLETSSGRNVTRPNNWFNWGINYPGNNEAFRTMAPESVAETAISGIGERSPYYKKFRTGKPLTDDELLDFAKVYEPNNASYGPNLIEGRKHIRNSLQIQ